MKKYYSDEKNIQMLIQLLKEHNIRKVIASPGATNVSFVGSIQNDPFFEIYSSVDERSAAYMACGLAAESGEPVVLSCTGATAARNYVPGLTEAFYRKLPVLAVTSTQPNGRIGHHFPQVTDRTQQFKDLVKLSVQIPVINSEEDEWSSNVAMNKAILELRHREGGPVHINLTTEFSTNFDVQELPKTRVINRFEYQDELPLIENKKIAIFIGNHKMMNDNLTNLIDEFCEKYNAVVFVDHTSNYHGKYAVYGCLLSNQDMYSSSSIKMDILIHLGEVSGAYMNLKPTEVWRVNLDGEIRDTFKKLIYVFEMNEEDFFKKYVNLSNNKKKVIDYYTSCNDEYERLMGKVSDDILPFSNVWSAKQMINLIPEESMLHLAILNSLRSWNYFKPKKKIYGFSNTGGFGIEGIISSLLGASLTDKNRLHFGVIGDLAFFYDMNALGNREFGNNIRLLLVNNGCGTEFHNYSSKAAKYGESEDIDKFIAAGGHFGSKSEKLVKHLAEDLGFEYITASNKEEYLKNIEYFTANKQYNKPIIFEIFTNSEDESNANKVMRNLEHTTSSTLKNVAKKALGSKAKSFLKKIKG